MCRQVGQLYPKPKFNPFKFKLVAYTSFPITLFRTNASILPTVRSSLGVGFREQPLPLAFGAILAGTHLNTRNMKLSS